MYEYEQRYICAFLLSKERVRETNVDLADNRVMLNVTFDQKVGLSGDTQFRLILNKSLAAKSSARSEMYHLLLPLRRHL